MIIQEGLKRPFLPLSEKLVAQHEQVQRTCDGLLKHFGVRAIMEEVQNSVWTQGKLFWMSYATRRFDGELTPPDFDDVPVGFVLQTEFPGITATYGRRFLGTTWSDGIDCRPGVVRGRGYHTVYGDLEFEEARIESTFTQFDIAVKPRWDDRDPMRMDTSPIGYDILVENWRLPSLEKPVKSAQKLIRRPYPENEIYEFVGSKRLPNPPREVQVGLAAGISIVIDAEDANARQILQKEVDEQIGLRMQRGGMPIQMIQRSQELIASMPEEFRLKSSGARKDFERWIKAT